MPRSRRIISVAILFVLAFHVVPILQELRGPRQTVWPIMAWGMYRGSRPADDPVRSTRWRITAISAAGQRLEVEPKDVGLANTAFVRFYTRPLSRGDASAARRLADRMNAYRDDPVVAFSMQGDTYTVTPEGLDVTAEPVKVFSVTD